MKKLFLTVCIIVLISATGCHNINQREKQKEESTSLSKSAVLEGRAGSTVYFAFDSFVLSDKAKSTLNRQAVYMRAHPDKKFLIEGNTDNRGTREYNLGLGERRANSAKNYLLSRGISERKIIVTSNGKEKPHVVGNNEFAWSHNRRTVTIKK